ncbi:hypothetical protein LEP1GSC034_2009 [Leptospira interrogans str. 2003000735]|uniref:Uncharacterized protein n=9 Tax=Leptospira interrogans TaxID=173 RepID=M3I4W0_LEPIR|nr:hypothetical protein G436_0632 [Leptospira interrogans serovar Hardjo str. Norma]EJP05671.1 hypothetical protein LEP1GSC007_0133 [Leptospira interrogans serovar Bulgarica str. Mallika]EJP18135.1 hypothetical protein LEP1GSC080_3643 [Leptospira interrogans str. FPW2026]EKN89650.1 hypothetical protein LEP1GSC027_4411 [Leptospira interrogans str. 2002000624]EKO04581.1 hypothetical protein LEP1GSC077_4659 [Leptospira interrogans str. C10069]EKO27534.1 hypothetical protein LEP1GSC104_3868 [Lepto
MTSFFQNLECDTSFKKENHSVLDAIVTNFRIFTKMVVDFGYYFHAFE